ncbi:hypothetical protein PC122_g18276 [Phytophthora cactorum]|nr:hypothetical protein PC122_g18276 [Phytophthora cactorum]
MSVRTINSAIRRLDREVLRDLLLHNDDNGDPVPVELCEASVDDWSRYVRSPNKANSIAMQTITRQLHDPNSPVIPLHPIHPPPHSQNSMIVDVQPPKAR